MSEEVKVTDIYHVIIIHYLTWYLNFYAHFMKNELFEHKKIKLLNI